MCVCKRSVESCPASGLRLRMYTGDASAVTLGRFFNALLFRNSEVISPITRVTINKLTDFMFVIVRRRRYGTYWL